VGIRKGVDAITKRNEQVAKMVGAGFIPELILSDDADIAIFRILTDDPIDVDLHQIRDTSISKWPMFYYCRMDDDGQCDWCEQETKDNRTKKRFFMFWIYVSNILHEYQTDGDVKWETTKIGRKDKYVEPVNKILLLRRSFGKDKAFWKQFEDAFDMYGTWKDREYSLKRSGEKNSINTTYSLTGLDKSPIPEDLVEIMGKLPPLESVAKGIVTKLDFGDQGSESEEPPKEASKPSKPAQKLTSSGSVKPDKPKPNVEIELPDVEDDLFPESDK
jgi:hypothetical protein